MCFMCHSNITFTRTCSALGGGIQCKPLLLLHACACECVCVCVRASVCVATCIQVCVSAYVHTFFASLRRERIHSLIKYSAATTSSQLPAATFPVHFTSLLIFPIIKLLKNNLLSSTKPLYWPLSGLCSGYQCW